MSVNRRRGYSLLESIIAMFILATVSIVIFTFQGVSMENRVKEKEIMEGIFIVESMKNMLLCNLSYEELELKFISKVYFINKYDIEDRNFYTASILDLVEEDSKHEYPLIEIRIWEEVESQIIKVSVNYKYGEGKEMSNVFYKGNYEKN
ncbi:MAG: prepilin-type N-terminal cleavage/methylation domain-containing protein [Clostridium sp.]|uniref:type IV pilus modification PilV family protein n=1 Tax=Clostridium sp. TaxID=1506 RepID=UPI00306DBD07